MWINKEIKFKANRFLSTLWHPVVVKRMTPHKLLVAQILTNTKNRSKISFIPFTIHPLKSIKKKRSRKKNSFFFYLFSYSMVLAFLSNWIKYNRHVDQLTQWVNGSRWIEGLVHTTFNSIRGKLKDFCNNHRVAFNTCLFIQL